MNLEVLESMNKHAGTMSDEAYAALLARYDELEKEHRELEKK